MIIIDEVIHLYGHYIYHFALSLSTDPDIINELK